MWTWGPYWARPSCGIRHSRSASHSYNKWFPTRWRGIIVMVVCLEVLPYSCIGLIIYAHSFVFIWSFHYRVHGRMLSGAIKFERDRLACCFGNFILAPIGVGRVCLNVPSLNIYLILICFNIWFGSDDFGIIVF